MLKTFKPLMLTILMTPIFVGFSSVLVQSPAEASTQVCNKTSRTITVAYAKGAAYAEATKLHPEGGKSAAEDLKNRGLVYYIIQGWYEIKPNQCSVLNAEAANEVVLSNIGGFSGTHLFRMYHGVYATSVYDEGAGTRTRRWGGSEQLCIDDSKFSDYMHGGNYTKANPPKCYLGQYPVGFQLFTSETTDRIINVE